MVRHGWHYEKSRTHALIIAAPLNLAFFATKALLFRALMSPAKTTAKFDPSSTLRRYFNDAVAEFQTFTVFMDKITLQCLHAFWGGRKSTLVMLFEPRMLMLRCLDARSQLILCGNFLIYLFLLAPSPEQVHATFELLEKFHESLQRLREWADDDASLGLLRPVALRIDSFFTQAAKIMKTGTSAASFSRMQAGTS